MRGTWSALVVGTALAACATHREITRGTTARPRLEVVLEHTGPGTLRARIEAGPARELRFVRRTAGREGWRARNAEGLLAVVREAGQDVLRSVGPLGMVEIELPEDERPPEKDYRAFLAFSQGGVLVYTGQLAAEVDGEPRTQRVTLLPLTGERIIAAGRESSGAMELNDETEDGTYVCFCTVAPLPMAKLTAVIDAGMWPEQAQMARELLPRLLTFYETGFGTPLPERPTVFISGKVSGSPRAIDIGGGTLHALIYLHLGLGSERSPAEPSVARIIAANIAHEAAHLWVGQLFRPDVRRGDWITEGAADALSWRALVQLGIWTREALADVAARAASICVQGAGEGPLAEARVKVWYGCGAMVMLAAEASARTRNPSADALSLWRAVFGRARSHSFSVADLFAGFAAAGAEEGLLDHICARVEGSPGAPKWEQLLREARLQPRDVQPPPEEMRWVRRDACGAGAQLSRGALDLPGRSLARCGG